MSDSPQEIKHRAVSGAKAMLARTLYGQGLRVISSVCLARLLYPHDYGVFGVVAYLTGLSMFLGDVGLAAALVRQKHEPSRDELFTVFICQQIFTAIVVLALLLSAGKLVIAFGLSDSAAFMLRVMSVGLFLSSLRIVPMLQLERAVKFKTIARCEMADAVTQTVSTIALAACGLGPWALALGGLCRNFVGLACVWAASPWRPQGRFRINIVKQLLTFGLPFQLNALLPSLLSGWMPFLVGRSVGAAAVGVVNWASNLSSIPMSLAGAVTRIAFPSFSRLQDTPDELARAIEVAVVRIGTVLLLIASLAIAGAPWGIPLVFGQRWAEAVPLFQWLSLTCVIGALTGILASAQNAVGRAGDRLVVTVVIGLASWAAAAALIGRFGLSGVGPTSFLMSIAELIVTCAVLRKRSTISDTFFREVTLALLPPICIVALAVATQHLTALHDARLWQTLISTFCLIMLYALRELLTPGRPLLTQLIKIWHQYRGRTTSVVPLPA